MGKLTGKKRREQEQQEERPAEQPDFEMLERAGRVTKRRRRQNTTVLGSIPGRSLG